MQIESRRELDRAPLNEAPLTKVLNSKPFTAVAIVVGACAAVATIAVVVFLAIDSVTKPPQDRARCVVYAGCDASGTSMGVIELEAQGSRTLARCRLSGLTFGLHGLHVHESANFTEGCGSTLGHYNPRSNNHGGPLGVARHLADFGNIMGNVSNDSVTEVLADVELHKIVGRSFVVHKKTDDLGQGGDDGSRATGNAGGRLGGGLIEWI